MPLTYSDVMARTAYLQKAKHVPYTGYTAILYAKWLPYAILIPLLASAGMIVSLFFPWFSIGNPSIRTYTGFQIASSGATFGDDTFSFPLLWVLVLLVIALIGLSVLLLRGKVLTPLLSRSIKLTFGLMLLVEVVYLITSLYFSFSVIRGRLPDRNSLAVSPSVGLWICMLVTVIAGGICLVLFSNLRWYWFLAQTGVEQMAKKTNDFSISLEFFR